MLGCPQPAMPTTRHHPNMCRIPVCLGVSLLFPIFCLVLFKSLFSNITFRILADFRDYRESPKRYSRVSHSPMGWCASSRMCKRFTLINCAQIPNTPANCLLHSTAKKSGWYVYADPKYVHAGCHSDVLRSFVYNLLVQPFQMCGGRSSVLAEGVSGSKRLVGMLSNDLQRS